MGYHIKEIKKGKLGTSDKIREELEELLDAEEQGAKIMCLIELSDMIGAIDLYLKQNFKDVSLEDLIKMSELTQRAFEDGTRN